MERPWLGRAHVFSWKQPLQPRLLGSPPASGESLETAFLSRTALCSVGNRTGCSLYLGPGDGGLGNATRFARQSHGDTFDGAECLLPMLNGRQDCKGMQS